MIFYISNIYGFKIIVFMVFIFYQQEPCKKEDSLKSVMCIPDEVILFPCNYNLFRKTMQLLLFC